MRRRCGSGGASGPGGGARCCRCVVAGALLLLSPCAKPITVKSDIPCRQTKTYEDETRHRSTTMKLDKNDEETRHPTHWRYRWWSGLLKGAVAGASPTGPWTDRRTGVRTPDHDHDHEGGGGAVYGHSNTSLGRGGWRVGQATDPGIHADQEWRNAV